MAKGIGRPKDWPTETLVNRILFPPFFFDQINRIVVCLYKECEFAHLI
jgi:hypothetical protein